jgi:transcriptional regulator with PAS, ATPase and Fis domain
MNKSVSLDQKQLDFYEATLNNLSEGVVWTDIEGLIVYCNDTAGKFYNIARQELLGQSIYAITPEVELKNWLAELITKPGQLVTPLSVYLNSEQSYNFYAVVNLTVGENKFNCFLMKKAGDGGVDPNEMLRIISEGTSSVIGGDFFRSLAYHIILSTGIRYAIVTECTNIAKTRVRTMVYIERDKFLDNFEYDITGTPCEIVMKGENYYCTADLDTFFPKDEGIKSYFGVPIYLSNGEVIGHIAVFDTKSMTVSTKQLSILKIFASRAGAEIERKHKDETIQQSMGRYKSLFDNSPIGLAEEDFSNLKGYADSLKARYGAPLKTIFEKYPEEITRCYEKVIRLNANNAQAKLFDLENAHQYFEYLTKYFQPQQFKDVILAFDSCEYVFEREVKIITPVGNRRTLKAKRVILHGAEKDWSKSIISCVDITEQKEAEESLKSALNEVKELKEKLEAENIYLQQEIKYTHNFEEIVSNSPVFKKVLDKIQQVAETDATVLILGESGTGKELISRAVHSLSKRVTRPLVKVNCATLPANLIESELFGHEKGAFTGALTLKIGRFELANEGTLFLDEIGELPLELQSKLLRVLQEGEFERVGSSKTMKVDVRIIAATNRDLQHSVNNKEFRSDLYYRLNVFPIYSPPLRERKEDIPLLVNHFCKKHGAKLGKKITSIPKPTLDLLSSYDWPGNVRELENIIERGLIISSTNKLDLGEWRPMKSEISSNQRPSMDFASGGPKSLEEMERLHIVEVLNSANWKIRGEDGAAKILDLNPTTLEARMKKLGITRKK